MPELFVFTPFQLVFINQTFTTFNNTFNVVPSLKMYLLSMGLSFNFHKAFAVKYLILLTIEYEFYREYNRQLLLEIKMY